MFDFYSQWITIADDMRDIYHWDICFDESGRLQYTYRPVHGVRYILKSYDIDELDGSEFDLYKHCILEINFYNNNIHGWRPDKRTLASGAVGSCEELIFVASDDFMERAPKIISKPYYGGEY